MELMDVYCQTLNLLQNFAPTSTTLLYPLESYLWFQDVENGTKEQ